MNTKMKAGLAIMIAATAGKAQCVQQWSGEIGVPQGVSGDVYALTTFDPDGSAGPKTAQLVVAGAFGTASGILVNKICRWDGVTWQPLSDGIGTNSAVSVWTLGKWDPDGAGPQDPQLIAAGHFTLHGNFIMRWDVPTQTWQPLGTGMNDDIRTVLEWDPDGSGPFPPQLIAGGDFTTAGGVAAARIARWDGANWQPLLSGMNNSVTSLETYDPDGTGPQPAQLVAGGSFTLAGGVAASRIARYDGLAWQPFGTGMNNVVWRLSKWDAGSGPQLLAGGDFTTANGATVNRLARYDGAAWIPFGTGFNGSVRWTDSWDPDGPGPTAPRLVAGGLFTTAGGVNTSFIANWDGTTWSGFGGSLNGTYVDAITSYDPDGAGPDYPQLVVGGNFTLAAGATANRIAVWASSPKPVVITHPGAKRSCPGGTVSFTVRAAAGAFPTYQWLRNGINLADGTAVSGMNVLGATSITLQLSNVGPADQGNYDVVVTNACGSGFSLPAALTFCYANCDCSTATPALTANDFTCFTTRFAANSPLANCDNSTTAPILSANDFVCFLNEFVAGCS
jgi:hypothetical protein